MFSKIFYYTPILLSLIITPAVFSQSAAQEPFSQSVMYEPRQFSDPKAKKRQKEGAVSPATVDLGSRTIPVSVLNANSKPVSDLDSEAFSIFVEGKKQAIGTVEKMKGPLNVFFLVESSNASKVAYKARRSLIASIVAQLDPNDLVSIIKFDRQPTVLCELTTDREKISDAIESIDPRMGASLYDTVRYLFEKRVPTVAGPKVVFLVTDGIDTASTDETFSSSLEWAEKSDAVIMPIYLDSLPQNLKDPGSAQSKWVAGGISGAIASEILDNTKKRNEDLRNASELGQLYLSDLAFMSGGRAVSAKSFENAARETSAELLAGVRQSYLITFKPQGTGALGARQRLLVRVNRPGLSVLAPGSFVTR